MTRYVVGFAFTPDRRHVLLICKSRPDWQRGRYNGIGGKVEPNEDPVTAMRREFQEETSVPLLNWREVGVYFGTDPVGEFYIEVFAGTIEVYPNLNWVRDEQISWWPVDSLPATSLDSIKWLVPMASLPTGRFSVEEHKCTRS